MHSDVVWVSEEQVRLGLDFTEEAWADLQQQERNAMVRSYLDRAHGIDALSGTRRMKTVSHSGFDVLGSIPWPEGEPEPSL